jgi:hypothetical protein
VRNFDKLSYARDHLLVNFNGQKSKSMIQGLQEYVAVQSDHMVIQLNMNIKNWKSSNKKGRREEQEFHKEQEDQN